MKTKIAVDFSTKEKLLAGLTPREVHPRLVHAEQGVADAERELERKRAEMADRERRVAEVPARVARGEVKASALTEALCERDAAALLITAAEAALAKARERVAAEVKNAAAAVEREVMRRAEPLERAAREMAPVLEEMRELSLALSRVLHPQSMGMSAVDWPCGLNCDIGHHIAAHSSVMPAGPASGGDGE